MNNNTGELEVATPPQSYGAQSSSETMHSRATHELEKLLISFDRLTDEPM